MAGIVPDEWQADALNVMLGVDAAGKWVAREYVELVGRQQGKALDVDTEVLTTDGWCRMGDLRAGQSVYHPDGHPTEIVDVSDVMHGHPCFEVRTTDGRSVVADAEHLWDVQDRRTRTRRGRRGERPTYTYPWETLTTRELVARGLLRRAVRARPGGSSADYAIRLPRQHVVVAKPVDLPVDPWLFGAWLGDGSATQAGLTVGDQDISEMRKLVEEAGAALVSCRRYRTAWGLRFRTGPVRAGWETQMRRLGTWGSKHVPDMFLTAGTEQRLALLQGLMDTDGSAYRTASSVRVEFSSCRQVLAEAVLYLARSLGWRATIRENAATLNGREVGRRWRVAWTPQQGDPAPFRLQRKQVRVQAPQSRGDERHAVSVASITPVPSRPVRCIKVARGDGRFLAGRGLIATHNTKGIGLPRALFGFVGLRERRIYWSAHQYRTMIEAFLEARDALYRLGEEAGQDLIALDMGDETVFVKISNANADRGFDLLAEHGGADQLISRWRFIARSKGAGRGLSGDLNINDETLFYTPEQRRAAAPTLLARPNPQTVCLSSPPLSGEDGQALYDLAERAAKHEPRLALRDWGLATQVDELARMPALQRDAFLDDRANWCAALPALGRGRASVESIEQLRREFATDWSGFAVEVLGMWWRRVSADVGWQVITEAAWLARGGAEGAPDEGVAFALDASWPDALMGAIAVAGRLGDELRAQVLDHRAGTGWMVERAVELHERHPRAVFVLDPRGPAGHLLDEMTDLRLPVVTTTAADVAHAYGLWLAETTGDRPTLRHYDQHELTSAVQAAGTRAIGDGKQWARQGEADISPLTAATLAVWAAARRKAVPPPPVPVESGSGRGGGELMTMGF